jgi:hypothetical protein
MIVPIMIVLVIEQHGPVRDAVAREIPLNFG